MENDNLGMDYGPAQERVTRTPISFEDLPPGHYGSYSQLPLFQQFPSLFQSGDLSSALKEGILHIATNDPNQNNTIRHEAIHQVLTKQLAGKVGLRAVQVATQGSPELQAAVSKIGGGNMADELPAYVISGDPRLQAPTDWKADYLKSTFQKLQKLNPQLANQIMKLQGPTQ